MRSERGDRERQDEAEDGATYCHCYPVFNCEPATAEVNGPYGWVPACERCMQIAWEAGMLVRALPMTFPSSASPAQLGAAPSSKAKP